MFDKNNYTCIKLKHGVKEQKTGRKTPIMNVKCRCSCYTCIHVYVLFCKKGGNKDIYIGHISQFAFFRPLVVQ